MNEYIYVVEGKHDIDKIRKVIPNAICVATNGTHIDHDTMRLIKEYKKTKTIVLVLDPDYAGEKIRKIVEKEVGPCTHIYANQNISYSKNKRKIGIEHISPNELSNLLQNYITFDKPNDQLTLSDMVNMKLAGSSDSVRNRIRIGQHFHIGYANAKELRRRLNALQINHQQIKQVLDVSDIE